MLLVFSHMYNFSWFEGCCFFFPQKTIDKWKIFEDSLAAYRKVKFKTLKCLPCFSVHDEGVQVFLAVLHVSVLLECKLLGNHHVRIMCTVCYIWCLFSLLHQTGQNKMSTGYCYTKIAVVCFHINSLQSQQSFCFFLGLRAVWVVSLNAALT